MIQIGIDPGVHTGFAVAEDGKLVRLQTLDFWQAYHTACVLIGEHGSLRVVIEVPKTKANWHGATAAHNVGRVCREAELLADGLELAGAQVQRVHPSGKVDAATFARITGWVGRTNEHQRDAGMLAITRAVLFQPRFTPPVRRGDKNQTMRKEARCKPGDTLRLLDSKFMLIKEVVCKSVAPVCVDKCNGVTVSNALVDPEEFARKDGFMDFLELLTWTDATYGLPFYGELISW